MGIHDPKGEYERNIPSKVGKTKPGVKKVPKDWLLLVCYGPVHE